jgi:ATP-dependent RNA helicase DDX42
LFRFPRPALTVHSSWQANEDIRQVAEVVATDEVKLQWLLERLPRFIDEGDVLVFANQKLKVETVEAKLKERNFRGAGRAADVL